MTGKDQESVASRPELESEKVPPKTPDEAAFLRLLWSYQALLDGVRQLRRGRRSPLRAVWMWSLERFAVEHVRTSLAAVERRNSVHAALSNPPQEDGGESRSRAAQFTASLPSTASRLRSLWLVASVLVVARVLFAFFGTLSGTNFLGGTLEGTQDKGNHLADAAARVGDLNLGNISELTQLLLHTSLVVTAYVIATFGIAIYLVLRPLACGAIAFRTVLTGGRARRRPSLYGPERELGERLRLDEREANVLAAVGIEPAARPRVDFVAKACLVAPLLLFAALNWDYFLRGWNLSSDLGGDFRNLATTFSYTPVERHRDDALRAAVIGIPVTLRLAWLWLAARRAACPRADEPRSRTRGALTMLAAVLVLLGAFGIYAHWDHRSPSLWLTVPPLTYQDLHSSGDCDRPALCVTIDVRYACDETCRLTDIRVLDLPHQLSGGETQLEDRKVTPSNRIGLEEPSWDDTPVPTHETRAETWVFTPRQSSWIRKHFRVGVQIEAEVEDGAGHTTRLGTDLNRAFTPGGGA